MPGDQDERTEQPSGKRRDEARKKGQVVKSKELISVFIFLGAVMIFYTFGANTFSELKNVMVKSFSFGGNQPLSIETVNSAFQSTLKSLALILTAPLFFLMALGVASSVLQTGFIFTPESITFDLSKMNPISGFSALFSGKAFFEGMKALFKVIIVSLIAYNVINKEIANFPGLGELEIGDMFTYLGKISIKLIFWIAGYFLFLGIGDYFYERWSFEKGLKMTKQEVKEEYKQTEGDPQVKGRIRQIQRQIASKRMMKDVPKADVIITNPTHFAIALKYDTYKMNAPKVIAKGKGVVAQNIIKLGKAHFIPVIEDKPLARLLYKVVEIGEEIPDDLYKAVAKILAYVYSLKKV